MPLTDVLVLPPDVLVIPVLDLAPALRRGLDVRDDDFAITRLRRRTNSKIVNAEVAELLQRFRTPRLAVDAVRSHGTERTLDPELVLAQVFPILRDCFNAGFLVPASSPEAGMTQSTLTRGDVVGGFEVLRDIQVLEDTELYQVRSADGAFAALKLASGQSSRKVRSTLALEAEVLRRLDGVGAPALLSVGSHQGLPWIAMRWQAGSPPTTAFREARDQGDRAQLLRLSIAILEAFARLHKRGIIHGDVQSNNIVIDPVGGVALIDFGCSRIVRGPSAPPGGVSFFLNPELAQAELDDRESPLPTPGSEQYSLAALLYWLLTGEHYLEFSLERRRMLSQIVEDLPLSFAARGHPAWPGVERILAHALGKRARKRYVSVAGVATAFKRLLSKETESEKTQRPLQQDYLRQVVDQFVDHCQPDGNAFRESRDAAPTSSITFGAAGIAYALYRIGGITENARVLALADTWLARAEQGNGPAGFYNTELDITPETVGSFSLYHTASGIHCTRALLGQAFGNRLWMRQGAEDFIATSRTRNRSLDLTLGRAGTLIGCASLRECLPASAEVDHALAQFGQETLDFIWNETSAYAPIGSCPELPNLGMAHGWAGILYASMWWCRVAGVPLPAELAVRLEQLARSAEPVGRGVSWSVLSSDGSASPPVPGWCNGSAGFVHLWTLAHACLRSDHYLALAQQSAWTTWEAIDSFPNLCCGAAGRVYALLNLYKHTGDIEWLVRARSLGLPLVEGALGLRLPINAMSLYKGTAGVAALAADLMQPESSSMPLFEPERWPRARSNE